MSAEIDILFGGLLGILITLIVISLRCVYVDYRIEKDKDEQAARQRINQFDNTNRLVPKIHDNVKEIQIECERFRELYNAYAGCEALINRLNTKQMDIINTLGRIEDAVNANRSMDRTEECDDKV